MHGAVIAVEDPRAEDVRRLLARHVAFANTHSPPEDVHALDVDALLDPSVTFYGCRAAEELLSAGALKQLDAHHAELKSMHTAVVAKGRGLRRAMVDHLGTVARSRGLVRVSLKTGTMAAFASAPSFYASAGFTPCGPFADYLPGPNNTFMTMALD